MKTSITSSKSLNDLKVYSKVNSMTKSTSSPDLRSVSSVEINNDLGINSTRLQEVIDGRGIIFVKSAEMDSDRTRFYKSHKNTVDDTFDVLLSLGLPCVVILALIIYGNVG